MRISQALVPQVFTDEAMHNRYLRLSAFAMAVFGNMPHGHGRVLAIQD